MADFPEIAHSGGKITVRFTPPASIALKFEHSAPHGMALFQIGVSADGTKMEYWPVHGVGVPLPEHPMIPTFVISDRQQLWGKTCPSCNGYFRTNAVGETIRCPYCSHQDDFVAFLTANQLRFVSNTRLATLTALQEKRDVVVDLDKLADDLPDNRPSWVYKEEGQQNLYTCGKCKTRYDILGEYASCPRCGKRNALGVVSTHFDNLEKQLTDADTRLSDRSERGAEWEKLLQRGVGDFEAFGRSVQEGLQAFPATPKRKKEISGLSFQGIMNARDKLLEWFGIDLFNGLPMEDQTFLHRMFQKRHLLTHSAGRVDAEYLAKTGDTSVRLHEKIAIHSKEVRRITVLLRGCAQRLFDGYESIE